MKYEDKSYAEKRKELRQFAYKNMNVKELFTYIIYHMPDVPKEICYSKEIFINGLLTDGFLAFERISIGGKFEYSLIDPINLIYSGKYWSQGGRVIPKNKIVYLKYSDLVYHSSNTSMVEEVMLNGLNKKDHASYIEIMIDNFANVYEKFDINYERNKKLERILK